VKYKEQSIKVRGSNHRGGVIRWVLGEVLLSRRDRRCNLKSPLDELFRPGYLLNQNAEAGNNRAEAHYTGLGKKYAESFCCLAAFVVNSEPHTGARPSVRVCGARAVSPQTPR
jgi:hypothetical protein